MSAIRRIWAVAALLLCTVCLTGDRAGAYNWFQVGGVDLIWPGNQSARWLSPTTFPPNSDISNLMVNAMGLWGIVPGANFTYFYGHSSQDFPIDHFDGFNDTVAVDAATLDPGVLAVTTMVYDPNTLTWLDMDMEFADFPAGVGWNLFPDPTCAELSDPGTAGINFYLVATHELGHALGLGHNPIGDEPAGTPWFIATMNPAYPSGGPVGDLNIVELHTDDRNGLRFLYPGTGPAQPDLALPGYASNSTVVGLAIPLSISPSSAVPGDAPTATSVIENFGNTDALNVRQGFYLSTDPAVDTQDLLLGFLNWDLLAGAAFQFGVAIDVPDVQAGAYYLGSILDDTNQVTEVYEDNNTITYCLPLTVSQRVPDFAALPQQIITCEAAYISPAPQLTFPINMAPVTWTLDNPQPGMSIDPNSGVITWPNPIKSPFLYDLLVRASNPTGSIARTLSLGVLQAPPQVDPIVEQIASCGASFTGPLPVLTAPICMNPITGWSLLAGPAGMTVDPATGIVQWPSTLTAPNPYDITLRAANAVGTTDITWSLRVVPDADLDFNTIVDLIDYNLLRNCLLGPASSKDTPCHCADLDLDNDIDLADFARLANAVESNVVRIGACCFGDGTCTDGSPVQCADSAGSYRGDGTTCAAVACTGACCFGTGGCLNFSLDNCSVAGGTFQGMQTLCATLNCPVTNQGACCLPDQSCVLTTDLNCQASFGAFRGTGVSCEAADCVLPFGACCHTDGTCTETTMNDCQASAGAFLGDATTCSAQSCLGACCYPNGGCLDLFAADCVVSGGAFGGQATSCANQSCPAQR
ncbi:MAG: putative Ig domain-containing protein [Phycisphaerae bacterium]